MKTNFYIALAACVLGIVALGLSFSPLGIYALISGILLGLASLAFAKRQKKKENIRALIYVTVGAYILLGVLLAIFIGGLIYSAI